MTIILVGLAATLGAACRYIIDYAVTTKIGSPWGTTVVNLSGALVLGLLAGLVAAQAIPASLQLPLGTGFLGAYTTFSTWMFETVSLAEHRRWPHALANAVGPLLLGPALAFLGFILGSANTG